MTALQRSVAPEMVARVFGVFFAVVLGAISLGTLITPAVVSATRLDAGLWVMSVGPFALGLLGYPALLAIDRGEAAGVAELAPRIAILESLGIFAAANRPVLERLAGAAKEIRASAGTAIVTQGEPADALYVLTSGSVDVSSRGERGAADEFIRTMEPGSYFGEIGLLEGIPRTATVTAAEDCGLLRIAGDDFLDALTTTPASGTLVDSARLRLARTHPSREPSFEPAP